MATFYKYVASARISTWLTSDGREEQRVERRMEVSAVEMEHGIRNEQQQHRPRVQARPEPSRKKTFLDGCCTNSLFHPFIDTDDTFTHGLWAVLTLPAICCISGIYCIVKAVKETIFWIVVLYIQLKPVELSDKGFYRYHVYLLIDFLTTVALIATGIGLEAGIGVKRCEFISSAVSISLPFPDDIDAKVWWVAAFCMSMDAFIPHIMIVFTIVVFLCVCFTLAHCPDEN